MKREDDQRGLLREPNKYERVKGEREGRVQQRTTKGDQQWLSLSLSPGLRERGERANKLLFSSGEDGSKSYGLDCDSKQSSKKNSVADPSSLLLWWLLLRVFL